MGKCWQWNILLKHVVYRTSNEQFIAEITSKEGKAKDYTKGGSAKYKRYIFPRFFIFKK